MFWALDRHSYSYYTFLRWITCGVAAYISYIAHENGKKNWMWIMGIMALVFNPVVPFHLDRETWTYIDFIAGLLMLLSIFSVRVKSPELVVAQQNSNETKSVEVKSELEIHSTFTAQELKNVVKMIREDEALNASFKRAEQNARKAYRGGRKEETEMYKEEMKSILMKTREKMRLKAMNNGG